MQTHMQSNFNIIVALQSKRFDCLRVPRLGESGPFDNDIVDMPLEVPLGHLISRTVVSSCSSVSSHSRLGNTTAKEPTCCRSSAAGCYTEHCLDIGYSGPLKNCELHPKVCMFYRQILNFRRSWWSSEPSLTLLANSRSSTGQTTAI